MGAVPGGGIEVSSVRGAIIRGISSALEKGVCVCVCGRSCMHAQVCGHSARFVVPSIITHYHINTIFTQQSFHRRKTTRFPLFLSDFLSVLCFPF